MSNLTGPLIAANLIAVSVALYFWHKGRRRNSAKEDRQRGIEFGLKLLKGELDEEVSQRLGLVGDIVVHDHRVEYAVSVAREARAHGDLNEFDLGYLSVMNAEDLRRYKS